ncbi:ADOP family duplicated permease [Acidicapsa dinghuensis]|uniref:ADOP family duplicated permease n=1 Tax=Acidicapsa dinghuensis TaxID=2218256 RepID=A0ABW1EFD4_9BACT|nr:ABC transporter permease [Acidicapsa dinghuensis]
MAIFRRILSLGTRERMEREINAELREHMAMCVDDNMAQGMSREEAERDARRRFGSPTAMRERVVAEDAALGLENLWQDVRGALRVFRRSPGFSLVVVVTLALGIGANTAIFEIFNAVRLRALPIANPGELVELRIANGNPTGIGIQSNTFTDFTVPMWREIKEHHDPLSGIFAWGTGPALVGPPGHSYQVNAMEVSGEFFNVLGVTPVQGRLIEPVDEANCQQAGVVVSYPFWKTHMGGEPITPKSTIVAGGQPLQVVGVTSPSFFGMVVGDRFDVAYTTCRNPNGHTENFVYTVMGRLKPGWTLKQATDYFDALSPGLFQKTAPMGYSAEALKAWKAFRLAVYPAGAGVSYLRNQYNSSLEILLAITGLVLLIACANLANLMLARASVKRREVAIRMSLGASRGRLLRQILLESALLAACGATLGAALAQPLSRALVHSLDTSQSAIQLAIVTDWRVLLFAGAASVATCLIFATLPALRSSSAEPLTSLKSGERGVVGNRERFSAQRALVITQIAVSMILLVGALLFIRSYRKLLTLNPGIRENNITIAFLVPNVKPEGLEDFKRQLVTTVRAIPGVENVATSTFIPLSGGGWIHDVEVGTIGGSSNFSYVSPSFFATLSIPVLEGRNFTDYDTMDKPLVVVVNQAFVRKYVGARSPLGVQVRVHSEPGFPARICQIIAVVPDTKYADLRADPPTQAFAPMAQLPAMAPLGWGMLIASRDPVAAQSAVQHIVDTQFPGTQVQFSDFQQGILDQLVGDRMMARLAGFFGILAALLVVVGLHGILSYFLAQRRSEIAIRIALGASRGRVVAGMLRSTCVMLAGGLVAGTALALLAGRGVSTLLFGLKTWDPVTLAGAAALLTLVTVIASVIPSLRAASVNPVDSLRAE